MMMKEKNLIKTDFRKKPRLFNNMVRVEVVDNAGCHQFKIFFYVIYSSIKNQKPWKLYDLNAILLGSVLVGLLLK